MDCIVNAWVVPIETLRDKIYAMVNNNDCMLMSILYIHNLYSLRTSCILELLTSQVCPNWDDRIRLLSISEDPDEVFTNCDYSPELPCLLRRLCLMIGQV